MKRALSSSESSESDSEAGDAYSKLLKSLGVKDEESDEGEAMEESGEGVPDPEDEEEDHGGEEEDGEEEEEEESSEYQIIDANGLRPAVGEFTHLRGSFWTNSIFHSFSISSRSRFLL